VKGGLLAILGGKPSGEEMGDEGDPFETGFSAFRSALKSGDAMKAKKAFRLMKEACGGDDEEGDDYSDEE
jgi:hypothetical protein